MLTVEGKTNMLGRNARTTARENIFGKTVYPLANTLLLPINGCSACGGGGARCEASNEDPKCNVDGNPDVDCESARLNTYSQSSGSMGAINTTEAYSFRDEFLKKSEKGKQYIDFYYKLSQVGVKLGAINLSTIDDHVSFAMQTQNAANSLQNGSDSSIPVTDEFYDQAMDMIRLYKYTAKGNREALGILTVVKADLDRFKGQSRAYIMASTK